LQAVELEPRVYVLVNHRLGGNNFVVAGSAQHKLYLGRRFAQELQHQRILPCDQKGNIAGFLAGVRGGGAGIPGADPEDFHILQRHLCDLFFGCAADLSCAHQ